MFSNNRIWNILSGECIRILKGHDDIVRCLHFDSKRIVSGSGDGKIKIWDLKAALDRHSMPTAICIQTLTVNTLFQKINRFFSLMNYFIYIFDYFQLETHQKSAASAYR